jgi:soluble lytic murein transglycosylase-like protein
MKRQPPTEEQPQPDQARLARFDRPQAKLRQAPPEIESAIEQAGQKYGLEPKLLRAVVQSESNYNPQAKGEAGELGLMQLMPETRTALRMTDEDALDAKKNIDGGPRWLKQKIDAHGGDLRHSLTAYNGSGPEARQYAENVLALYGGP